MITRKRLCLLSCLLVLIFGTSCICSAKVKILKIGNKKFNILMQVGDKLRLKLKKINGKKIQWKSSNKAVVSINSNGCIKAKKTGRATITAIHKKVKIKGKVKIVKNKEKDVISNVVVTATPIIISPEQPVIKVTETPVAETPTVAPTEKPVASPTVEPTVVPTKNPAGEPTVEPTVEPTKNPAGEPTLEPTVEPTEKPAVQTTDRPIQCVDSWLFIEVDQEEISKDTRFISGEVYNSGMETIVKAVAYSTVTDESVVIAEKILKESESTFSLETDFSECKGMRVSISVSNVGESLEIFDDGDYIVHWKIWPDAVAYDILGW